MSDGCGSSNVLAPSEADDVPNAVLSLLAAAGVTGESLVINRGRTIKY
jgi:hypothetical protein